MKLDTWHFASPPHRAAGMQELALDADAWCDPDTPLLTFDRLVHAAEDGMAPGFIIVLRGERTAEAARQIALRYQRLFAKRNDASASARFDALLRAHLALHDRGKPLVRADHDHAIDVWQWVLKLAPHASEALQIAALFHDIERLASEADRRIEQHAADYLAFKQRHAAVGAGTVLSVLRDLQVPAAVAERAVALVARHEQPTSDEDLRILNDADALSFFGLNSAGFLAYFGEAHTRTKVAYTLGRMRGESARGWLRALRLEPAITAMIDALEPR